MNEAVKTLIYLGVAVVVALVAIFTYPTQEDFQPPDLVGKPLFADFSDPEVATELKIVKFDEDLGELSEFEVARDSTTGLWSIPSSSNYPADAETQMRDAATSLIDLQVLDIVSQNASDHQIYGVVEPDKQKLDASEQGVGLLVSVEDTKGKDLAKLIIGKAIKGVDGLHFVRKPGQNPVYVVKIDPAKFPTEFEKWIERDLLKMNTLDVQRVSLRDYSIVKTQTLAGPRGKLEQRLEADVTWDADKSKWALNKLVQYKNGEPRPTVLLDTEELNTQKLNDLKSALASTKIVGVMRKPTGLGADLKAGAEIMKNEESLLSLMNRGFYPVVIGDGEPEIRAANGEVLVGMKDGIEYVLRFGEIDETGQGSAEGKLNRYLFVTARLDDAQFPPLQLEPLPGGDDPAATEPPKEEAKEGTTEPAKTDGEEAKKDESVGAKSDLELERERIRKENQRKQDERDEKLKKARQKVAELNSRFADWYYVIAEDEYKKIHLGRNDLIKETATAKEEGFGIDSFRQLQQEGIEKKEEAPKQPPASFMPPGGMPGAMPGGM